MFKSCVYSVTYFLFSS